MRNLKLVLSYDGTEFSGWQVQPEAATVQGALASAIGRVTGERVLPQGSGRTDAGVHALGQVATFATQSPIPPENLVIALNDILPSAIRVLEAAEYIPVEQLGTTDDCGFSPFADDTSTSRDTAFAKVKSRVEGTAMAGKVLGV